MSRGVTPDWAGTQTRYLTDEVEQNGDVKKQATMTVASLPPKTPLGLVFVTPLQPRPSSSGSPRSLGASSKCPDVALAVQCRIPGWEVTALQRAE
jgi:hypothetical protein